MSNNYTWDDLQKVYEHPEILCWLCGKDRHTKLHGHWIKYIWGDTYLEKVLMAHRGSMKTTAITEIGSIWRMMFFPDERIFIVRKTFTEAADNIRTIQSMMLIPEVSELLRLAWFGPKSKDKWDFAQSRDGKFLLSVKKTKTKEPSLTGFGVESQFTGQHAESVICDDVVTLRDRISQADRERTKIIVRELRSNIIDKPYCVQFVGTPWRDGTDETGDAYCMLPPAEKYPANATGLLSPAQLEDLKKKTSATLYSINYDLAFNEADDQPFQDPTIADREHPIDWKEVTNIQAHLDASYDGDHSSALTIMGRLGDGKLAAIGWKDSGNVKKWIPFIAQKIRQYKAKKLFAETNADKGFVLDIIKTHPEFKAAHAWVHPYHEEMNKSVKISTYLAECWADILWDHNTDDNYLGEITSWIENDEPDDCPDSAASIIREGGFSATREYSKNFLKAWKW